MIFPISNQMALDDLDQAVAEGSGKLSQALLRVWRRQRQVIPEAGFAHLIQSGKVPGKVLSNRTQDLVATVVPVLNTQGKKVMRQAAKRADAAGLHLDTESKEFRNDVGFETAGHLARSQTRGLEAVVQRLQDNPGGIPPKEMSLVLRETVGLTPMESLAVTRLYETSRHAGSTKAAALRGAREYGDRLRTARAQRSAEYELSRLYHTTLARSGAALVWRTHHDERTCPACAPLDGTKIEAESPEVPPLHLRCRCTVTLQTDG